MDKGYYRTSITRSLAVFLIILLAAVYGAAPSFAASGTANNNASKTSTSASSSSKKSASFADMTNAEFNAYLKDQGFPVSYRSYLRKLHKAHPNWVFVAQKTGISWNTALDKEAANGVSLIHSSLPLSYRSTDSRSYKGTSINLYSTASTSKKIGTLSSGETVTLVTEVWKGTTRWSKVTTGSGRTGYVKGSPNAVSHDSYIKGKINSTKVNVRKGAGTDNKILRNIANKNTTVYVVLRVRDKAGDYWYKIRSGSGYGYIKAEYVSLPKILDKAKDVYPYVTLSAKSRYWPTCNSNYPGLGYFAKGSKLTAIAKVTNTGGTVWYQVYNDGKVVYIKAGNHKTSAEVGEINPPNTVKGKVTADALNIRASAGTSGRKLGELTGGTTVTIKGTSKVNGVVWFKVKAGSLTGYVSSEYVDVVLTAAPSELVSAEKAQKAQNVSALTGKVAYKGYGIYIPKDGLTWFNASRTVVAYYMDPRNFLNEDRVYMFEDLTYQKAYQTRSVVSKVISPTRLPGCGFSAKMFVSAGAASNVSPVHLASRARQETGGGSIAISGYRIGGVKVYNPFNIGASSCANPVVKGLRYAYSRGWTTQKKAVNGGADFLASGYISKGQNSPYLQRFNVANGVSRVGTHQYMTNIQAPYSESYSTKTSYAAYKITSEPLTFIIPVYKNMPDKTELP